MFHRDIQIPRRDRRGSSFDKIRGVWIADETLSRVFDISAQSKQKLTSKRRNKIVKFYVNKDRVSKPPNHGYNSICFKLMNY